MPAAKLLMLINFFPPTAGGGVYRPLSFVRHLSRMGWEITVVTPRPGEFWISDSTLMERVPAQVRVVRTASLSAPRLLAGAGKASRSSSRFEALRRLGELLLLPDAYASWLPWAVRAADKLCRAQRFDAVYSTSPPDSTHLAARIVARRHGIRWVADFRDPWISLHLRRPPTRLHGSLQRRMERSVVMDADEVVVTSVWHASQIERCYGRTARLIRNGFEEDEFEGAAPGPDPDAELTITHCGMLTQGRRSRTFLEGLELFLEREPAARGRIRAVFIGARESRNEEWARRPALEGAVFFEGNLPHALCLEREQRSHVLLLIKNEDKRYQGLVPGKLYEYIGARRPVLALAPPGEAAGLISRLRRGEVAGTGDPQAVAERIARLYHLHRSGALERTYDLSPRPEFSRRVAAHRLDAVLRGEATAEGGGA